MKEATARIKINKLLEAAGWRFFSEGDAPANIRLEPTVTLKSSDLDALGNDFEKTSTGFIDFLLLDAKGFPLIVLEAKSEDKNPLIGKEKARKYARSQNCRFVILSNGNLHYFWDLERGNPNIISSFPAPDSVIGYQQVIPNPQRLIEDQVADDYIVLTQQPNYASAAAWKNVEERSEYIQANKLRFLRPYQLKAIRAVQRAVKDGKDRFLLEMATGTGKTLTAAAIIKLFLRSGNAHRVLFLVDRLELEDQAEKNLAAVLSADYETVIYKEKRDQWRRAEIVVTTVQSLLFNNKYQQHFSPTDFDLVISDEAHRSITGNARAVFDYFIGYKLGLTATPRDYLRRFDKVSPTTRDPREAERRLLLDTYRTFGCESGQPTFRYSLLDGVYDISPDMVRLSRANLYLHGFIDPHIYEYDTLTSQDRWNDYADVILANPPFMSPKGGIKPHNRFSVKSNRSEVLFVDYIAEHLSPNGRAGVIVPEGVIFQSQTAYRELRKMLVESYLVAVISLPAGVFNPYSGVKTSILILDKALAKQSDTIGFFKVANDGFGLGAQRRPIEKNDLPQLKCELETYLRALRSHEPNNGPEFTLGQIVAKERIVASGYYNLSGERYRIAVAGVAQFPIVTLGQVCEINPDTAIPSQLYQDSYFNYIDISCVENKTGKFLGANRISAAQAPSRARRAVKEGDVLISTVRPNLRAFTVLNDVPERAIASTGFAVLRARPDRLLPDFLLSMLRQDECVDQMTRIMGKGSYPSINHADIAALRIPLPPLEVQKEVVAAIESS